MKSTSRASRRVLIATFAAGCLVALYALVAGVVAPSIARQVLAERLSQTTGRTVTIDRITFHPFTWQGSVGGFRMLERDGSPFASFETLDVDLGAASLRHLAPVADAVTMKGLRVNVVRLAESEYNVSDILSRLATPAPPKDARAPQYSLANIRLQDARIDFDDRPIGAKHAVTQIDVALPFLSNMPLHRKSLVRPSFAANVNGSAFKVEGETLPFDDSLTTRVVVDLKTLDLRRYLGYAPTPVPMELQSGSLDGTITVSFEQPPGKPPSMRVSGKALVRDLAVRTPRADARAARLAVEIAALDPLARTVHISAIGIEGAEGVGERLRLPATEIRDVKADFGRRTLDIASIASKGGAIAMTRTAAGTLELPFETSGGATSAQDPWRVTVSSVLLEDHRLTIEDNAVKPAARHSVLVTRFDLGELTSAGGGSGRADARVRLDSGGDFHLAGTFVLEPLAVKGKIDARNVNLLPLRGYAPDIGAIDIRSGRASAAGAFVLDAKRVTYRGNAQVMQLATVDLVRKEPLLDWRSVRASDVDLRWSREAPLALAVDEVAIDGAYSRVIIHADGKLNLQHLRAGGDANAPTTPASPMAGARDIRIARVTFADSRLDFTDNFIKPNYNANVGELRGSITDLSSDPATRGTVRLEGRFDKSSPVTIEGTANPLAGSLFLDVTAKGRDIELPRLSAYSMRYAGYGITEGKLALDVSYRIEDGKLEGRNKVVLDQLTFGEKVESPDAINVPLIFAVNLLKDKHGRIDLELPVSGSLEDPQFEFAALVGQVVSRLLKKVITNPFSVIAAAFGGNSGGNGSGAAKAEPMTEEDLAFVEFEPGRDEVAPKGLRKLETLGRALEGRPGLKLELSPRFNRDGEVRFIKIAALNAKVAEAKRNALGLKGDVTVTEEEYPQFLRAAYAAELGTEQGKSESQELALAVLESRLLERAQVDKDLETLATRRADAIRKHLLAQREIAEGRVVLASAGEASAAPSSTSRMVFALR